MDMRDLCYRRRFGVTADESDALLAAPGGGSAICPAWPERDASLHVDHDRVRGRVRGILCLNCDQGIGPFREDLETARSGGAVRG